MPLPTWPTDVTYEVMDGWRMPAPWLRPIATEMEGGNLRIRRRPGDNVAVVEYPLVPLTDSEFTELDRFFRDELFNGASRFNMKVWTGTDYEDKVVQFEGGDPPQYSPGTPGKVMVTMRLRIYGM
jgi:hypothetical protein